MASRILLIDLDDPRRETRVRILTDAGYEVAVRNERIASEQLDHEGRFDLVIIALHGGGLKEAASYSNLLARAKPTLPILLLTDIGVFVPKGTLSNSIEAGDPPAMMREIAAMLANSTHIRELEEFAADD